MSQVQEVKHWVGWLDFSSFREMVGRLDLNVRRAFQFTSQFLIFDLMMSFGTMGCGLIFNTMRWAACFFGTMG